jgi:hypothetical protein
MTHNTVMLNLIQHPGKSRRQEMTGFFFDYASIFVENFRLPSLPSDKLQTTPDRSLFERGTSDFDLRARSRQIAIRATTPQAGLNYFYEYYMLAILWQA